MADTIKEYKHVDIPLSAFEAGNNKYTLVANDANTSFLVKNIEVNSVLPMFPSACIDVLSGGWKVLSNANGLYSGDEYVGKSSSLELSLQNTDFTALSKIRFISHTTDILSHLITLYMYQGGVYQLTIDTYAPTAISSEANGYTWIADSTGTNYFVIGQTTAGTSVDIYKRVGSLTGTQTTIVSARSGSYAVDYDNGYIYSNSSTTYYRYNINTQSESTITGLGINAYLMACHRGVIVGVATSTNTTAYASTGGTPVTFSGLTSITIGTSSILAFGWDKNGSYHLVRTNGSTVYYAKSNDTYQTLTACSSWTQTSYAISTYMNTMSERVAWSDTFDGFIFTGNSNTLYICKPTITESLTITNMPSIGNTLGTYLVEESLGAAALTTPAHTISARVVGIETTV